MAHPGGDGAEDHPEMIKSFTEETLELCEEAESALLELERMPDAESAGQAFRAFHSIKGNAGFFGYGDLERISHLAENVLDQIRNGEPVCDQATMSVLLKVVDAIRNKLSDLSQGSAGEVTDISQLCDMLVDLASRKSCTSHSSSASGLRPARTECGELPWPERMRSTRPGVSPDAEETSGQRPEKGLKAGATVTSAEDGGAGYGGPAASLVKEFEQFGAGDEIPDSGATGWPEEDASRPAGQAEDARPLLDEGILKLGLADLRSEKREASECEVQGLAESPGTEKERKWGLFSGNKKDLKTLKELIEDIAVDSGAGSAPHPSDLAPSKAGVEGIGEERPPQRAPADEDLTSSASGLTARPCTPHSSGQADGLDAEERMRSTGNLLPRTSQLAGRQPETKPVPSKLGAGLSDRAVGAVGTGSPGSAPSGAGSSGPGAGTVIRVDIDKLDKMLDLVGELVIAESMVSNNQDLITLKNERFGKAVMQLDKISREIQEVAMSMRMIPLAGVFRKMMRLVRDLAQKANKQVELEIIGEETEVDKTIIEQISDPLVHLIRNAVDHGLETPAERLAAGKPETGRVTLEAKHSAGEVWITVEDDGKGLNRDKIFQKGIEKGLVRSEDREMKDEDIWRLIFEPGFSTAEQVSSISGRGVGMDVVKRNIERLRGKVDIRSRAGVGTIFAVRIPLTLAIIEGMVVRVGAHRYTIPISSIKESFRPGREQITSTPDGLEIVRIRGELQPVLRLHELYRVEPRYFQLSEGILIMVENSDNKCCLFVDELLGQQQIVIKGLPGYLSHVKGVSGCAILGDGEISLILDIAGLISSVDEIMH